MMSMDSDLEAYETDSVNSDLESYLYSQIHYESKQEEPVVQTSLNKAPFTKLKSKREVRTSPDKKKKSEVTCSDDYVRPVVKVFHHDDLKPEKQNRRRPDKTDGRQSFSVTKHLARKRPKKSRDVKDSSSDSDCAVQEITDEPVVINIDSASDDSCIIVEDNASNKEEVPVGPLWHINMEDRFKYGQNRKREMNVRCHNCNEKGHLSKSCTQSKKVSNCYLCGEPGHSGDWCLNPFCSQCLLPGHLQIHCRWSPAHTPLCQLCFRKGHLGRECPSIWRRYHLTTAAGPLVTRTEYLYLPRTTRSCYNCGNQGHYAHVCKKKRKPSYIYPVLRTVSDYSDPRQKISAKLDNKLWKKKLRMASLSASQMSQMQGTHGPSSKRRRIAHQPNWKALKAAKMRDRAMARINPTAETSFPRTKVRINPAAETAFPRTKKKIKMPKSQTRKVKFANGTVGITVKTKKKKNKAVTQIGFY